MAGNLDDHRNSLAAPFIFLITVFFQVGSRWLEHSKKRGVTSDEEIKLRREIKQLLKEASKLSEPSTFAQAAKLRRVAAAKERELVKYQESQSNGKKLSYDLYLKRMLIIKVFTYIILVCWFWRVPVATVTKQLVQPFGKVLSWKAGGYSKDNVMVGIIPWLILSNRVASFICQFIP